MSKSKFVYIVLSRSPTVISLAINSIKGDDYTHAALSLDKSLSYMFSFGRRRAWNPFIGCFKHERIDEGLYKALDDLPGVVIEIPVTNGQYLNICGTMEEFLLDAHVYEYNYLGLAGNLLGIVHFDNTRFFCSEFVYYVLRESGVCDLGVPRGMVRPQTLLKLKGNIIYEGNLKAYLGGLNKDAAPAFSFLRRFSEA